MISASHRGKKTTTLLTIYLSCLVLSACAVAPLPDLPAGPNTETIYLIVRGWHTAVGLPAAPATGPLGKFRTTFPGVRTITIGFGDRAYLTHPHPGIGEMIGALTPGPGAFLVTALKGPPQDAYPLQDVVVLHISVRGYARMTDFIVRSLQPAPDGTLRPLSDGPYPGSLFYTSATTYSILHTCNTWTAEALQAAGLPVRANGVLFANGITEQARHIAAEEQRSTGR